VESHLEKLARREQALIARTELLEGRIGEERRASGVRGSGAGKRSSVGMSGEGSREALRLKQLRGKKERLSYAVERLVLQAQQKERQLRMSVAAQ
jgi:DASH complex subunit SPC19